MRFSTAASSLTPADKRRLSASVRIYCNQILHCPLLCLVLYNTYLIDRMTSTILLNFPGFLFHQHFTDFSLSFPLDLFTCSCQRLVANNNMVKYLKTELLNSCPKKYSINFPIYIPIYMPRRRYFQAADDPALLFYLLLGCNFDVLLFCPF